MVTTVTTRVDSTAGQNPGRVLCRDGKPFKICTETQRTVKTQVTRGRKDGPGDTAPLEHYGGAQGARQTNRPRRDEPKPTL